MSSGVTYPKMLILFVWWSMMCTSSPVTDAFNVDTENALQYRGEPQTMFGFSVAQHKEQGRSWVLIGAPDTPDPKVYSNYKGGVLFHCDANQNDSCQNVSYSSFPHAIHGLIDNTTRQGLGATVLSSGEDGVILVCAPRYLWFQGNGLGLETRDPVGTCYLSTKNFSNFAEYSPCRVANIKGRYDTCQAGFSAAISKNLEHIYLGAVGAYYAQGAVFSQSVHKNQTLTTKSVGEKARDTYMGYSMAGIEFTGEGKTKIPGFVVGIPKEYNKCGKVRLMAWNLTVVRNITAKEEEQEFGSYFGYSVAVADVDGDKADDVIVGAPLFSNLNSSTGRDVERGRVYVFYQAAKFCPFADFSCWINKKFSKSDVLDGPQTRSRFGTALASVGDINLDGYEDFAVGAPYEGVATLCGTSATSTGAVYVYHGSKSGVRKKFSQVILASEMSTSLSTFGFSLAGGLDLDDNEYPDLVVGAYESDTVYLFKSRPVIYLSTTLNFNATNRTIDLDADYNCGLGACMELKVCLNYTGVGVPKKIVIDFEVTLDAEQARSPRMFFNNTKSSNFYISNITVNENNESCETMGTYVRRLRVNDDKLTPLQAKLTYHLSPAQFLPEKGLTPLLNQTVDGPPFVQWDSLSIKNNCGNDKICKPNLKLNVTCDQSLYTLGSGQLAFNVSVRNRGEDSYGTVFKMKIPPGVNFSTFEDYTSQDTGVAVQCYPPENETIRCDVGNPLSFNKEVNFSVILEPRSSVDEAEFKFWANVTMKNPQVSSKMRSQELSIVIPILEETHLMINRENSKFQIVYYNASQYDYEKIETDIEAGPFVRHEYTIKNLGPSDVLEAEVIFDLPSKTPLGEDLWYLFAQPKTEGPIKCEPVANVNYRGLQIKRRFNDRYFEYDKTSSRDISGNGDVRTEGGGLRIENKADVNRSKNAKVKNGKVEGKSASTSPDSNQGSNHSSANSSDEANQFNRSSLSNFTNPSNGSGQFNQSSLHNFTNPSNGSDQFNQSSLHNFTNPSNASGQYDQSSQNSSEPSQGVGQLNHTSLNSSDPSRGANQSNQSSQNSSSPLQGIGQFNQTGLNSSDPLRGPNQSKQGSPTLTNSTKKGGNNRNSKNSSKGGGAFNQSTVQPTKQSGAPSGSSKGKEKNTKSSTTTSSSASKSTQRNGGSQNKNKPQTGGTGNNQTANSNPKGSSRQVREAPSFRGGQDTLSFKMHDEEVTHQWTPRVEHFKSEYYEDIYHNSWSTELSDHIHVEVPNSEWMLLKNRPSAMMNSKVNDEIENHKRKRRATLEQVDHVDNEEFCSISSCTRIVCKIEKFPKGDEASVILPAIVWARTIHKVAFDRPVEIGSYVMVNVTKLPHRRTLKFNSTYSAEILSRVSSLEHVKTLPKVIPLWIFVSAACFGTLILMLLVYILFKCGFFERNRPPPFEARRFLASEYSGASPEETEYLADRYR